MYKNLGTQWGSSIPAFLSFACVPMPFVFYKYGGIIRAKSKYAVKAKAITEAMLNQTKVDEKRPSRAASEADVEEARRAVDDPALQEHTYVLPQKEDGGVV